MYIAIVGKMSISVTYVAKPESEFCLRVRLFINLNYKRQHSASKAYPLLIRRLPTLPLIWLFLFFILRLSHRAQRGVVYNVGFAERGANVTDRYIRSTAPSCLVSLLSIFRRCYVVFEVMCQDLLTFR